MEECSCRSDLVFKTFLPYSKCMESILLLLCWYSYMKPAESPCNLLKWISLAVPSACSSSARVAWLQLIRRVFVNPRHWESSNNSWLWATGGGVSHLTYTPLWTLDGDGSLHLRCSSRQFWVGSSVWEVWLFHLDCTSPYTALPLWIQKQLPWF